MPRVSGEEGKLQNLKVDLFKSVHTIQGHSLEVIIGFEGDKEVIDPS